MGWRTTIAACLSPAVLSAVLHGAAVEATPAAPDAGPETAFAWLPATAPVPGFLRHGGLTVDAGFRALGGGAWQGVGAAFQGGVELTPGISVWSLAPVIGWHHARGSGEYDGPPLQPVDFGALGSVGAVGARSTRTGDIDEVSFGARRAWSWRAIRVSLGGGGCWVHAAIRDDPSPTLLRRLSRIPADTTRDTDAGLGWWGAGGVDIAVVDARVGIQARYTDALLRVLGDDLQAGGWQFGGTIRWEW